MAKVTQYIKNVFFFSRTPLRTPPGVRNGITYGVRNEWKGGVRNQRGGVRNKFEIFKSGVRNGVRNDCRKPKLMVDGRNPSKLSYGI